MNETKETSMQVLERLQADGIIKILPDPHCTACGADLDEGGHYHGCGNAGRYDDEPPTRALERQVRECRRCGYEYVGRSCSDCVREERDRDRIDATEARS